MRTLLLEHYILSDVYNSLLHTYVSLNVQDNVKKIFSGASCRKQSKYRAFSVHIFQMFIFAYLLSYRYLAADRYMCCLSINRGVGDADINSM